MNINITLLGEMITFFVLVFITVKYIWPPFILAMKARQQKIADGLAEAERGRNKLKVAEQRSMEMLREVRLEASQIFEKANTRANQLLDEAKFKGIEEGQRMIERARLEIHQQEQGAREHLRQELVNLMVAVASKILEKQLDPTTHHVMIENAISEI